MNHVEWTLQLLPCVCEYTYFPTVGKGRTHAHSWGRILHPLLAARALVFGRNLFAVRLLYTKRQIRQVGSGSSLIRKWTSVVYQFCIGKHSLHTFLATLHHHW